MSGMAMVEALMSGMAMVEELFKTFGLHGLVLSGVLAGAITLACLWRPFGANAEREATAGATKAKKKKKQPKVIMCRFCNVEIPDRSYMDAHLAGKRHVKLAACKKPHECWVWIDKTAKAKEEEAEKSASVTPPDDYNEGEWVTAVDAETKKKRARVQVAKQKAAAAAAAANAEAQAPQQQRELRVHRRCDECGIRAREGAIIETDPDDERRAYCTDCWYRYFNPEPEPEAAPTRHVTPWN
jgi:hypothetical protein